MNIYIIPAWYPENKNDITASFIREQTHSLFNRNHNITVIVVKIFSIREIKDFFKCKNRVWNDNGIITKYYKRLVFTPSRFEKLYHKKVSLKYYRIIKGSIADDKKQKKTKPDIIHSHVGPWCSYFVIPAAKKLKLPIVTTEHYSGLTNGNKTDLKFRREKYVIENSDLTIFVGSNFKNYVLGTTNAIGETEVIPNMIDSKAFSYVQPKIDRKNVRFLTACRLVSLKKVENIIEAFHQEFDVKENVEYLIAGDGPMKATLMELVHKLDEDKRIKFLGSYKREEVLSLFSSSDIFVLTSQFETFGIVYLEALMCGIPCIATKGQGADDIINNTNGFTVEYGNVGELRKKMRYLFNNINKYDRNEIIKNTASRFDKDVVCAQLEEEYKKILQKNNR